MKIISYNVNGIRAALSKGFIWWLTAANPDMVCLQEVKANPDQLDFEVFGSLGYQVFWMPAVKKGYSGVAILTKITPKNVVLGCNIDRYDCEGRVITLDFDSFSLMSVYMPSGSSGETRQEFKMVWLEDFYNYIKLFKTSRPNLIISGDYNICHQPIDIHNPKTNKNSSGFLPEERSWMDEFIDSGFTDTFRYFNPEPHNYTWWSYRAGARQKNLGWRIDYHMVTEAMNQRLKRTAILKEAFHSDHCPILLEIE